MYSTYGGNDHFASHCTIPFEDNYFSCTNYINYSHLK